MNLIAFFAMTGLLVSFSAPGFFFIFGIPFPGFFAIEGVIFILISSLVIGAWAGRLITFSRHRSDRSFQATWHQWATIPFLFLIAFFLIASGAPLDWRFALSRDKLNNLAQSALTGGPRPFGQNFLFRDGEWVGAFEISGVQVTQDGEVDFLISGTGTFMTYSGISYCPSGQMNKSMFSRPLSGPWYEWTSDLF